MYKLYRGKNDLRLFLVDMETGEAIEVEEVTRIYQRPPEPVKGLRNTKIRPEMPSSVSVKLKMTPTPKKTGKRMGRPRKVAKTASYWECLDCVSTKSHQPEFNNESPICECGGKMIQKFDN